MADGDDGRVQKNRRWLMGLMVGNEKIADG
jgi:hypothetical protein